LTQRFRRRRFLKIGQSETRIACGAKGNMSFCQNLASIVCRPLTFRILIFSSETSQPNELTLGIYERSSLKMAHLEMNHSERRIACGGHVC
jgi:hypothetical protein